MGSPPSSKRQDLQGIRGLAIISVLGFHFYPLLFPNGYLGVDQFFVLSGFLMCMLLTKTDQMAPLSAIVMFYSKRFKRILPLYLFVILLTLIALYTIFPESAVLQNEMSATKALFFVSNRQHTGEEDYFEKLSIAIDLFTHTWSLSVEIQFYFIVPFIFLLGNKFSGNLKYGYYFLLGFTSLFFYFISPTSISFNSVFARIWQFLIGMLIFIVSSVMKTQEQLPYTMLETEGREELLKAGDGFDESEDEDECEKQEMAAAEASVLQVLLSSSHGLYCHLPNPALGQFATASYKPLFTVFTGILMLLSIDDAYLSNRFLTYIGDISYSLYLIHWPVFAYVKLTYPGNQYLLGAGLVLSVFLAIVTFETFEKWYLKLSNVSISILILVLFSANLIIVHKDTINEKLINRRDMNFTRLDGVLPNMTFDDADRLNNHWSATDLGGLREPGCEKRTPGRVWCDYNGTGTEFKLVIFGNSLTENHHKMFLQECRYRAYNVTMYSEYGCEPLAALSNEAHCKRHLIDFVDFLTSAKPDYAFLLTRFFATGVPFANNVTNLETDPTYQEMRSQMKKFTPHIKKKLFVLDAFPRTNRYYIGNVAKDLKKGRKLDEIHKELVDLSTYDLARFRTEAVVKECGSKCELIDYQPLLFNETSHRFEFFDSHGFAYFTSVNHLSAHGMELVRPIYTKICANLT